MFKSALKLSLSLFLLTAALPALAEQNTDEATAPSATQADQAHIQQTQLRYWIKTDFWGHQAQISRLAAETSPVQRYQLYLDAQLQAEDLYGPTLLNVLPGLGLGSFIQGDANAGGWILGGQIAGAVLLGLGSSGAPASIQPIFALSGSLVYLGTTIYGLVAPMQYRDRYNAALKQSLQLNSHSQAQQPDSLSWASATLWQF